MSSVIIAGNTSGTVSLTAPDVAGTTVITLPATSGTMITGSGGVVAAANGGTGLTSPGTAGNVLTSDGTSWTSAAAAAFDSGTRIGFQQTSAPTGWTKDTTAGLNDSIMRIVTGSASSGGSTGFSAAAIGATTLSTAQIPSHAHTAKAQGVLNLAGSSGFFSNLSGQSAATSAEGGGGSHVHSFPAIKYYDFIIAQKS